MAKFTEHLGLTLPELNEFVNSWNTPLNENLETLDDYLKILEADLVGAGSSSGTWSLLKGTHTNLANRLAVSLNPDGTVDLSSSPEISDIATSNYRGQFPTPVDRLEGLDAEVYDTSQPFGGTRFAPGLPSAGFPKQSIGDASAFRARDFGADAGEFLASPGKPYSPGLVTGGDPALISSGAIGQFTLNVSGSPAIFNIDGYLFRLREGIKVDYSNLSPANNEWVWVYVERDDTGYTGSTFLYDTPAGSSFVDKDLRRLRSGTGDGVTSGSTFTVSGQTFNAIPFEVKPGDLLVVSSGAAAGSYVIDSVDGPEQLTIKGIFRDDLSGVTWYILDDAFPNIGAEIPGASPTLSSSRPSFVAGRVYIGRIQHQTGGPGINAVTFTRGGVYDSGWSAVDAGADFPKTFSHNLGVVPSRVEIWVREASTDPAYRPMVRRQIQTDDTPTYATLLLPSMQPRFTEASAIVDLLNTSTVPAVGPSLFTDTAGSEVAVGEMRVVAWR